MVSGASSSWIGHGACLHEGELGISSLFGEVWTAFFVLGCGGDKPPQDKVIGHLGFSDKEHLKSQLYISPGAIPSTCLIFELDVILLQVVWDTFWVHSCGFCI